MSESSRELPLHLVPVIVVGTGALLVLAALFMPNLASDQTEIIHRNMLIQNSPAKILCPIAALISAVRYWNIGSKRSAQAAIWAGAWFFCWTIYQAYDAQLVSDSGVNVETEAGLGLWTSGIGCLIVALGGLMMRYPERSFGLASGAVAPVGEVAVSLDRKQCPRCAETIKSAAKVCRFCQHEMEPGIAE